MMARDYNLLLAGALVLGLAGCAQQAYSVRPLTCPIVECKFARCQSPPMGMPYMSDRWRCVLNASVW